MSSEEKDKKQPEMNTEESDFFTADPMARYKEDKKASSSGTRKNIILIICGLAVVAALAAGVACVVVSGVGKNDSSTDETTETADENAITLFDGESSDDVSTVELTNSEGTFEIYRSEDATDDENAVFTLKGYEDYKQDSSIIRTIANNPVGMSTSQTIAVDADNLDKYGLGDDAIKVTVTMDNGESESFRVGDATSDESYKYFCLEGENTVYIVDISKVNNFSYGTGKFISSEIEEAIDDDSDFYVKSIDIKRTDIDYDIVLEYDEDAAEENDEEDSSGSTTSSSVDLVMKEPAECNLNADKSSDTVNCIFGMSASEIVKLGPTEEELSGYGFDTPDCEVTIKTSNSKTYVFKVGDEYTSSDEDDTTVYRYIYVEGAEDIVYGVTEDAIDWAYVEPIDISSKIIIDSYVWDIESLKVEGEGREALEFVGTGSSKNDYVVTKNGETCETERYRAFYAFLIKAYGEEFAVGEEPQGEPMLTVTYKEQDGGKGKTISFYDAGNTKCLITVDGKASFKCRKSFVETVLSNIDIFDTDEDFITTWE